MGFELIFDLVLWWFLFNFVASEKTSYMNRNVEIINCSFPYEIRDMDAEANAEVIIDFKGFRSGFVEVGPQKYKFQPRYRLLAGELFNFQVRPDDIWISTFPRSGTTWTQELIWLLCNDFDYETAKKELLDYRFPYFELSIVWHDDVQKEIQQHFPVDSPEYSFFNADTLLIKMLEKAKSPRFIKTHLPISLMPRQVIEKQAKVIYVARNPKDVLVSSYHHYVDFKNFGFIGDLPRYWEYFKNGTVQMGPYFSHVKEGWNNRHLPNVLFLFYEDLSRNLTESIHKVAKFLGKTVPPERIEKLLQHLHIDNFRNNTAVNFDGGFVPVLSRDGRPHHVRKGGVGGWKAEFTQDMIEEVDKWIEENLADTDLRFPLKNV